MNWSNVFIPLERDVSAEVVAVSHRLMIRAGLIQQVAAGVYAYTTLGLRVIRKIEGIIRKELEALDFCEILLPNLQPKDLWSQSGRDATMKQILVDANGQNVDMLLGPTCEELVTSLVGKKLNSHRKLPMRVFQIQNKFRDEPRPQFGLVRTREFLMKDAYSFHADVASLDETYRAMGEAYTRIFKECGVDATQVAADAGDMGGAESAEFVSKDLEIGHIFKLGEKYSHAFGANYQATDGQLRVIQMGCYGIGVGRLLAAIIENNNDANGIVWPKPVSPFDCLITLLDSSQPVLDGLENLKKSLTASGRTFLVDNRDERPGVKFNDADLLGMDRITVGKRGAELKIRRNGDVIDMSMYLNPQP